MSRPLLVHAFSIGGYTFAQLLVHVSHDQQKYQEIVNRIKGQVYDSLVIGSLEQMATGKFVQASNSDRRFVFSSIIYVFKASFFLNFFSI